MNYKMMGRFIAQIVAIEAVFMVPALAISLGYGEWAAVKAFAITLGIMLCLSGIFYALCRRAEKLFGAREGLACVALSWMVMSLLGALPFVLCGQVPNYIDALFEIISGFTTTGASVIANVEGLYKGILYWRSFSHWIGGMGVLVFLLAILPGGGGSGFTMHLLRAESPGPDVGKLVPKMKQTAVILYSIYIALTALNIIFLLCGGMSLFESVCTAFGTAGTGGFGVLNSSMADYSPYIQWVTTIFMALFGVNFSVYFFILIREYAAAFFDEELRLYWGVIFVSSALITFNIRPLYDTLSESIRHAAFQVCTVMTTTGYATTDFDLWPSFSKTLLVLLMLLGASAGSTGGGLKMARVLLLIKTLRRNITQSLRPHSVQSVLINKYPMDEQIVQNTNAYLSAYCILTAAVILLISLDGGCLFQ